MTTRRNLLKAAATVPVAAAAASIVKPAVAQAQITWRMQTYAGPALAEHVVKPAIDMFNKIAGERMQIELFFSDQIVPTGELFRAMQRGTIDAVQSDDDSMASPTEVTVFGGYFPFASRYSLDVPVLFNQYGLNEIWAAEYEKVGIKHISAGAWDPCHFATKDPIHSLADLEGKRVFTFPTAGRFLTQFGVVPVTLPWEDIEVAVQTGELDGVSWSGITEDYTVGWADVTNYFLTNNISGAWIGSFYANMERWNEIPEDLQTLLRVICDQSPLLSPVVVLGRRGQPARARHEDGADLDPRRRMGPGRGRSPRLLGRDRSRIGDQGQGGRDLQAVQRGHGEGRKAIPLRLIRKGGPAALTAGLPRLPRKRRPVDVDHGAGGACGMTVDGRAGPETRHGPEWKATARRIGATPRANVYERRGR